MLFDLRGRGRRRTVQGIYLTLAVLMGGGLVLFGIGGATSGGLLDAINGGSGSSSSGDGAKLYENRVANAKKQLATNPSNAVALEELTRAQYQLAGFGDNFDRATGAFTAAGRKQLKAALATWDRYVKLDGHKVNGDIAALVVQAETSNGGLGDFAKAAEAQEFVIDARAP